MSQSNLPKKAASWIREAQAAWWNYHGSAPVQRRRTLGLFIDKRYVPGISKDVPGLSYLKFRGGKALCYVGKKRSWTLVLFKAKGRWHFRKGQLLNAVFYQWMFENASTDMSTDPDADKILSPQEVLDLRKGPVPYKYSPKEDPDYGPQPLKNYKPGPAFHYDPTDEW